MAKSSKLTIKLDAVQIEEVAYWVAAMTDSSDPEERKRLAANLIAEIGLSSETMEEAQELRREVNARRHQMRMRELRQQRRRIPATIDEILTIDEAGHVHSDQELFYNAPYALRKEVLAHLRGMRGDA